MIKSLPGKISSEKLRDFSIGNQEAGRDELLDSCFCRTGPIDQFLKGGKDYLIGVKGTGKSAVFRQLISGKIKFENKRKLSQILVPIDQDIDYLSVKSHIRNSLDSAILEEDVRARFVWEIYILYRIARTVLGSDLTLDEETSSKLRKVVNHFSFEKGTPSIVDIFMKANRTIGCKIDTQTGIPVPDFYIKAEPNPLDRTDAPSMVPVTINISDTLNYLNGVLRRNSAIVFVLVDNLDDFLAREEYDAQRLVIQGLLACSRNYARHQFIKLRLFLRNEVFHKAEFEKIGGAEKVTPNAVFLEWGASDIRRLIAERFIYNFFILLNLDRFEVVVNNERFRRRVRPALVPKPMWRFFFKDESRRAMDITHLDQVWRITITSLMPRTVQHYNGLGQLEEDLDLFEYIETHFSLANSRATPRSILIYLDKLISISGRYYSEQLYPDIPLNEEGEYPLFLKEHIQQAYQELQKEIAKYISSSVTHPEWKDRIDSLMTNIGRRTQFTFRDLRKLIKYDNQDADAKQLLAFLEHLGVLVCENKSVHLPDRKYNIPILLQRV